MFEQQENQEKKHFFLRPDKKWLLPTVLAIVFVLVLLILGTILMLFEINYNNKFYPGSRIGQIDLSGLTKEQAFTKIDVEIQRIDLDAIKVEYLENGQAKIFILPEILSPDSANDILEFDSHKTVYDNFNIGRNDGFLSKLFVQWRLAVNNIEMKASLRVNSDYLEKVIREQLSSLEVKENNASPQINCIKNDCQITITDEKTGTTFNYQEAIKEWQNNLTGFKSSSIKLKQIIIKPEIKRLEAEKLKGNLERIITVSSTPIFVFEDKKWQMTKTSFISMMIFFKNIDNYLIAIDNEKFNIWFKDNIGSEIDIKAQNATVQIIDGKVTAMSAPNNGRTADVAKAFNDLNSKIINLDLSNWIFPISVVSTTPEVAMEDVNNLGIKEIIGVGESNFAGSPTNRRKNIATGSKKLNGLLIKPDEEFSVIKALGEIEISTGYFPELVIKGNKTTPEVGGGLCQVGTTMFRAALGSGLPILERTNHSYSVTYYLENGLPGVDATIYDPKPDLVFKNDTSNYILIQTRIDGNKLTYEFWGTKDGRSATRTKPRTWGVKSPPPLKTIITPDLPVGEKKCTESQHNGISASFNYIVDYSDGHTATTTFTSVYRPWQAVCLVGGVASSSDTEVTP